MNDKTQILTSLKDMFKRWEAALAGLSEEQISAANFSAHLSIKDVVAHLMAWQQISVARLEAALPNREPVFPAWLMGFAPESEEHQEEINASIYATYREPPWATIHRKWRDGFLRFLELSEAIPENDLMQPGRYTWLNEHPLAAVLLGSYEHHEEHLESLLAWIDLRVAGGE